MRHLTALSDLTADELRDLIDRAVQMKTAGAGGRRELPLSGRTGALFFEKPSLRTRVSFEAAMAQLGGSSIFVQAAEVGLGKRESIPDFARVVSQYVDVLVARVFHHQTVSDLAAHATVPVINGLSDLAHPCQALADLQTVQELFGGIDGRTIAFVGDGNNVARSLAEGSRMLGARFVLAAPRGYEFSADFLAGVQHNPGTGSVNVMSDPVAAVAGADVVYTDVWTSMGQEQEGERRRAAFAGFQVNAELLRRAPAHAKVMHCLPAHRGEEIASDVMDGPQSVVFQQAGNRLHAQKSLLVSLLAASQFRVRRRKSSNS
jgi:ornithine carbamoyltransferase